MPAKPLSRAREANAAAARENAMAAAVACKMRVIMLPLHRKPGMNENMSHHFKIRTKKWSLVQRPTDAETTLRLCAIVEMCLHCAVLPKNRLRIRIHESEARLWAAEHDEATPRHDWNQRQTLQWRRRQLQQHAAATLAKQTAAASSEQHDGHDLINTKETVTSVLYIYWFC